MKQMGPVKSLALGGESIHLIDCLVHPGKPPQGHMSCLGSEVIGASEQQHTSERMKAGERGEEKAGRARETIREMASCRSCFLVCGGCREAKSAMR